MHEQIVTRTGGLRWGTDFWQGVNVTWPFARLRATKDHILISVGIAGKRFKLPIASIVEFRRKHGIISVGARIERTAEDAPPHLVFWTFGYFYLEDELFQRGHPVSDYKPPRHIQR